MSEQFMSPAICVFVNMKFDSKILYCVRMICTGIINKIM